MGLIAVMALLILLGSGIHVAVALAGVSIVGLLLIAGPEVTVALVANVFYVSISSYSLVLVPLFILMGHFADASGVVADALKCVYKWFGWLPGGLALTTTVGCGIFAAACGSSSATVAAIGKFVIPEMERYGYSQKLAAGTVAASGTLGILIPPSIVLVIYGIMCEVSIGQLFMAGILPGVLSAAIYMAGIIIVVLLRPQLAPPAATFSWKERIKSIPGVWGILLLATIIMGGIYAGVFTPTEAGGMAAFASLVLLLCMMKLKHAWKAIRIAIPETVKTTAMVFIIMISAILFSRFLTLAGVFDTALEFISKEGLSPLFVVTVVLVISTIMGCFMSAMAVLLIIAPHAYSVLTSIGFDGLWVGIIMVKLFELAAITPPVGINVYVTKGIAPHIPIMHIFQGIAIFAVMDVITIALLIAFPEITLWLPKLM